jgi:hypothetical protein
MTVDAYVAESILLIPEQSLEVAGAAVAQLDMSSFSQRNARSGEQTKGTNEFNLKFNLRPIPVILLPAKLLF